jgi:hypothetical protein
MNDATMIGRDDEWFPRRGALLTALGVWVAGFALGGASLWRMQHASAGIPEERTEGFISESEPATEALDDTAEPDAVMSMPRDVIVAHRTPRHHGVTLMQAH